MFASSAPRSIAARRLLMRPASLTAVRGLAAGVNPKGLKILTVLYPDPVDGFPPKYARDTIPEIKILPKGQTAPTPKAIDFKPGELLGCVSGGLGLGPWLERLGVKHVVTSEKDGPNSTFEKELVDADVVISQPFWPAYLTAERFAKAKKLKLVITAGIGSDHTDLAEACKRNIDVVEVTGSNSVSVAEHEILLLLALVRNFVPAHAIAEGKLDGWNIADAVSRSYDLEGMDVGTVGAGRIGIAALQRLKPFGVKLHYYDQYRLPPALETELGAKYYPSREELIKNVDAVLLNCPLYPGTEGFFDAKLINSMRRGSYIVNNARGKLVDRDAVAAALKSGQLGGYAGDVWFPQPAPKDHPWRTAPHNAMTPHMSGTSLSAQTRYAAGTREILECFFEGRPYRSEYLIVKDGKLAGVGAQSYKPGSATSGAT